MFSKLLYPLDFNKLEARNMVLAVLGSAPSSPATGQCYYDSALAGPRWFDGTSWTNKATDTALLNGQNAAFYLARANHTGTQLAATISDLATTVQGYRLDQFGAPTAAVSFGGQKGTNQADPTNPQDSATKAYVDSVVQSAAAGIDSKPSVRAVAVANVSLTGTQTIDGVALVATERVLLTAQTTGSQNGVYVVAAGAWARAADGDATGEITDGATWFVEEGTVYGASTWRCGNPGTVTLGTTAITITQLAAASSYSGGNGILLTGSVFSVQAVASGGITVVAGGVQVDRSKVPFKATATIGNGSLTSIAVNHNLGTSDVTVSVRDASTNEMVGCKVVVTDTNNVTLSFGAAPASNSLKVVVIG